MKNDSDIMKNSESVCPICKSKSINNLYNGHISLSKCKVCGIFFNNLFHELSYDDDYFTLKYKKQYGRTYIEDFNNIYAASIIRLKKILKLKKNIKDIGKLRLLDIGSALGFFLKAALDLGIKDIQGIEVSCFAAEYCTDKFKINVINSYFSDVELHRQFDIITAWYFLEHTFDPLNTVAKIYNSLIQDGIFAFSAPSFFGPQYLFNRGEWLKTHPIDHRLDFSPKTVKRFLKRIGFRKIHIFPGAIHPERIIPENSILFIPFKKIYFVLSGILPFSDTMEVYAVK